jgi:hypothetical protein
VTNASDDESGSAMIRKAEDGEGLFRSPHEASREDDVRPRDGGPEAMRRLQFPFEVEADTDAPERRDAAGDDRQPRQSGELGRAKPEQR